MADEGCKTIAVMRIMPGREPRCQSDAWERFFSEKEESFGPPTNPLRETMALVSKLSWLPQIARLGGAMALAMIHQTCGLAQWAPGDAGRGDAVPIRQVELHGVDTPPNHSRVVGESVLPAYMNASVEIVAAANTSRQAQQEALALIPWQDLNQEGRRKIKEVVDHPSIYRRLPVSRIQCDPNLYQFSIRNPETIIGLWQVFGVTTMGLQRTGPYTYIGDDGAGTDCTAELVYGDNTRHIYVGTGTYEGPVFRRKLTGRCVAILKTDTAMGNGQHALTNQLDIFLRVDNLAADLVARTLQPLVGRTADHNFNESLLFLQAFSETAARDPQRVTYLTQQLQQVEPATRQQFQQVVQSVQLRQQELISKQNSGEVTRVQLVKPQ